MISPRNNRVFVKSALAGAMAFSAFNANALTINATYLPGPNALTSGEQAAFNYVISQYDTLFTNNATVNINLTTAATNSYLGQSNTSLLETGNTTTGYNLLAQPLLNADSSLVLASAAKVTAQAGTYANLAITSAEAKALNIVSAQGSGLDGTITFSSSFNWDTNTSTSGSIQSNQYDFIGVAEHELSEVLGRISGLTNAAITPLDMLRYSGTAPTGVNSFSTSSSLNYYLSLNGGISSLTALNAQAGGDLGDFNGNNPNDPFNAFTSPGQFDRLNGTDTAVMQALGYSLAAVPLPPSLWLFASACLGMGLFNKKSRRLA